MVLSSLSRGHFRRIPVERQSKIVHVAAAKRRVMADTELAAGSLARERALGQIEFADSLVARLVDVPAQVDADGLRRGDLMLDARPDADPVRRLLDQVG